MRFSGLDAHHDVGVRGINNTLAEKLVRLLTPYGRVFITSERPLNQELEPYRIAINPLDIHHVMAFADIYIGDSQTMAAESGVLGVPFVRFNDFVGKIGYLNELECKYKLGYGIKPDDPATLFNCVGDLLNMPNRKEVFRERRQHMLAEKINFVTFLTNFIESYKA